MAFNLVGKAVRRVKLPIVDYNAAPITIIPVQEGDVNSRYFEISLYDDNGDVDLSNYTRAILSGETPSGVTLFSSKCEFAEDGKSLIVVFGGGFTAQAGRVACNITFTNGEEPSALTSQTFYVIVSQSQIGKIITENEEEYNALLSLISELEGLERNIEDAESARVVAENDRVKAENDRVVAENNREEVEGARVEAETARENQENLRQQNETTRQSNETSRLEAETQRCATEQARAEAESAREYAEQNRGEAETAREVAEALRQSNEDARSTAESQRVVAEDNRATAESKRSEDFQTAIDNCDTATQKANDAAQDVREFLDALPCPTNKIDGETVSSIVALNFVAVED